MFWKKKRKGQSALEYLVTYGWAILAIVIIAAVLWYFGIFNPSAWAGTTTRAIGFTSFTVLDQKWTATGASSSFSLGNIIGQEVEITTIKLNNTEATVSVNITAGSSGIVTGTVGVCGTTGTSYTDQTLTITYTNKKTGLTGLVDSGKLTGKCA